MRAVDAVEEVEGLERVATPSIRLAQDGARVGERREMVRVGEEALPRILEDRIELRVLREDALGVVVGVMLAATYRLEQEDRGGNRWRRPR